MAPGIPEVDFFDSFYGAYFVHFTNLSRATDSVFLVCIDIWVLGGVYRFMEKYR